MSQNQTFIPFREKNIKIFYPNNIWRNYISFLCASIQNLHISCHLIMLTNKMRNC